jgi:hypothetical protein
MLQVHLVQITGLCLGALRSCVGAAIRLAPSIVLRASQFCVGQVSQGSKWDSCIHPHFLRHTGMSVKISRHDGLLGARSLTLM